MTILDVGCGPYKLSEAIGVDLVRFRGIDIIADALNLPFRSKSFDFINANQIIEHVDGAIYALSEWKRLLKPQGKIRLCLPNVTYYRRLIRYILNKPVTQNHGHIQCVTISELMNLTEHVGLKILSSRFITEKWRGESVSRFRLIMKHLQISI